MAVPSVREDDIVDRSMPAATTGGGHPSKSEFENHGADMQLLDELQQSILEVAGAPTICGDRRCFCPRLLARLPARRQSRVTLTRKLWGSIARNTEHFDTIDCTSRYNGDNAVSTRILADR